MKWIGQHIWDLTSRFRNDIYFEGLAETAETRGLVVDANGKVSINPLSGDEHATHIYENVRNDEGATIPVGTPVYSKGEIGGSERIKVGIADASDPAKMPAIGITNTELTTTGDTQDGLITLVGVYNTNLSGFSGVSENDVVYVAPGGGLTISKPAGTNLIQNVGIVLKTNGTIIQGLQVTCIGRTNDIPNSLQLRKADGTNAGLISMTGNDMVLSNATGDVLIGSTTYQVGGDQDIFIGDGINSVDLVFEQSGAIKGYDSSVNLTIGGGGGTITFADPVSFVGGGINDEFQFNNLTIDGNFELSPITTSTSGGVLNGGFLNPAAEAKQVHMPQVLNDLAGFNHWGTVTVTGLYKTRTGSPGSYAYSNPVLPGDFANAFDGTSSTAGSWYSDNGASGTVQGEGVITLEWTNEATYGLWFGLVFGSDSFVPSRIKMEAYQTDVGWRTFADLTGVSYTDIGNIILRQIDGNSGTGQATNKLRFTLGHKNSGDYNYFRIHTIYLANYAQGQNNLSGLGTDRTRGYHYLERYRPNYAWGHFNPGQTTTYNLGGSSYRWAIGYFNSLDVAQSLNIAGSISAGSSVGNLNVSAGIGQDLEYGSTAVTTLRFDSDRWRLYAGGTSAELMTLKENGNVGIGTTDPTSKLDVNGAIRSRTGSLLIEDTDSSDIHAQINSNSTEGVLRLRNGANWGMIARGIGNSPRLGAYHNGDLRIYGFGAADGADHANDDELARFDFANERLIVNGQISVGGNITTSSNSYLVSSRKFTARDGNGTGLFADDGTSGLSIADDGDATFTGSLRINSTYPRIFLTDSNHNDDWSILNNDGKFGIYNDTDTSYALSINGSNNVGIGTTSPESKLHITDANPIFIMEDTSNPNKNKIENVDGNMRYHADYNSNMGNSRHIFFIDNSEKVRFEASGNVGIGTTSPASELDVNGTITLSGDTEHQILKGTSSSYGLGGAETTEMYGRNILLSAYDDVVLRAGTSDEIRFFAGSSGAARMTIDQYGKVGIGTASPGAKLEVSSDSSYSSDLNILSISGTKTGGTAVTNVKGINVDIGSNDHVVGHDITNLYGAYINNNASGTSATVINNWYGVYVPAVDADRVSNSVSAYFGDNVGIGTSSPAANLHIIPSGTIGWGNLGNAGILIGADTGAGIAIDQNEIASKGDHLYIGTIDANRDLVLRAGGTASYLTLDSSAGTIEAGKNINVTKSSATVKVEESGGADVRIVAGGATGYIGTYSNDTLQLMQSGSAAVTIDTSKRVGIGTTSPSYALDIKKDSSSILHLYRPNSSTAASTKLDFSFNTADASQALYARITAHVETNTNSAQGGDLSFHTANAGTISEVMRLTEDGKVGIGTTSPSELLTIAAESPTLRFEDISSSNYTEMYVNNFDTYLNTNGRFFIQNQGSTKVTFKSDGNVGIGTTSPSEKLEVNGKIKATDINFSGLPTSSAGLSSGDVWNDGGTLKIVS